MHETSKPLTDYKDKMASLGKLIINSLVSNLLSQLSGPHPCLLSVLFFLLLCIFGVLLLFLKSVCLCLCGYIHMNSGTYRAQKRVSDTQKLELQALVKSLMSLVLGDQLKYSGKAVCTPKC